MPSASALGHAPEPVFSSPVSVLSLRPSLLLVSERASHTNFYDDTLHNFGAAVRRLVCCAAFVVASSFAAGLAALAGGSKLRAFVRENTILKLFRFGG
jgi:hypothetical protein